MYFSECSGAADLPGVQTVRPQHPKPAPCGPGPRCAEFAEVLPAELHFPLHLQLKNQDQRLKTLLYDSASVFFIPYCGYFYFILCDGTGAGLLLGGGGEVWWGEPNGNHERSEGQQSKSICNEGRLASFR